MWENGVVYKATPIGIYYVIYKIKFIYTDDK